MRAPVLGATALALSAVTASAADLAAPGYGYGAPAYAAPGYGYAGYGAPATAGTTIIIVTPGAPAYTAPPVASGYYNYAPGYWGGYRGWRAGW